MRSTTLEGVSVAPLLDSVWFGGLSDEVKSKFLSVARLVHLQEGEYFYKSGDDANGLFGLLKGDAHILMQNDAGQEEVFHQVTTGFWVGDLALLSRQKRLVSVRCLSETTTVHLPAKRLLRLTQNDPEIWQALYHLTYLNMALALNIVGRSLGHSPSGRVYKALQRLQRDAVSSGENNADWVRITQCRLAEVSGVSAPTVQRVLKKLQQDGAVEIGYGKIRIVNAAPLTADF